MNNHDSWFRRIIKRSLRSPRQKFDKTKIERPVEDDSLATHKENEVDNGRSFRLTDYGTFVHISFKKEHILRNPNLVDVMDPVTRRMRRVDASKARGRTTRFYREDGSLIND